MKNDTFESLVPGPKCSGPKSIGPKLFPGRSCFGPKLFPGRSCFGPKYFWAKVSGGPKLSSGLTGCEPMTDLLSIFVNIRYPFLYLDKKYKFVISLLFVSFDAIS